MKRGLAVKAADRWNTAVMPLQVLALMFAAGIVATGLVLRRRDSTGRSLAAAFRGPSGRGRAPEISPELPETAMAPGRERAFNAMFLRR